MRKCNRNYKLCTNVNVPLMKGCLQEALCAGRLFIHSIPTGVYLVESLTECGVLLSYLEAVTCAVGG